MHQTVAGNDATSGVLEVVIGRRTPILVKNIDIFKLLKT